MKGARFEEILGVLGSEVFELTPIGRVRIPMGYDVKATGGTCTFIEDHGSGAIGPIGYDETDLRRVLGPAKAVVLASRDPDPATAQALELLLIAHLPPCTVIITTVPERHATWTRFVRLFSSRGPVMHITGKNVDIEDDRAPVMHLAGLPAEFERAMRGEVRH
ncbi:hypothetical protein [Ralstonia pseudosolanacearum]|uniref:hypothetical protein n=1 Tax=Ralstonia pseudosolanacearum TaxID=1310165 RepID=UPI00201DE0B9|nr:hypothetical protein [Ralstonia pseudosolanacearum]UQY83668.1 hypothetical protein JNO62_05990 [Ralstonia pseudosolanacearum]